MTEARPSRSRWAPWITLGLTLSVLGMHLAIEPRFFYWDDVQHTFMPVFTTIGERLRAGDWPSTTLLVWQGGFLSGEGLYQLFNPVSLSVFWFLPAIDDIAMGAALHATVYLLLASLGCHLLASRLGAVSIWSVLAGISYAASPFLLYWLASSWVNGLVAYAALPWTLYFLAARGATIGGVIGLSIATYLVGVSGWIHAMIAVALFGTCRVLLRDSGLDLRSRSAFLAALAAGALLAAPQLLATLAAVMGSARPSGISNNGVVVASLQGLLMPFWPTYVSPEVPFSRDGWSPPIYYGAWFVLPAFIAVYPRMGRFFAGRWWLVLPAIALTIATLGPDQLGPTRWPLRFLPASILALLALSATALSENELNSTGVRRRAGWALAGPIAAAMLLSWQSHPDRVALLAMFGMTCWWLSTVALGGGGVASRRHRNLIMSGGTLLILAWFVAEYPINSVFEDYYGPRKRPEVHVAGIARPGSVVQVYSHLDNQSYAMESIDPTTGTPRRHTDRRTGPVESMWLPSGNMPMWRSERQLNGYTPVEMLSVKVLVCGQSIFGWTCDGPARTLLTTERITGKRMIDLLRVDAVLISTRMPRSLEEFAVLGWPQESPSPYLRILRRPATSKLPGTVSFVPAGASVTLAAPYTDDEESLIVARERGFKGGPLVLARAIYPGHVAEIDGQPVPVKALNGVLLSVQLPPGSGPVRVDVRHELPFPWAWRISVAMGLAALLAGLALAAFRRPAAQAA